MTIDSPFIAWDSRSVLHARQRGRREGVIDERHLGLSGSSAA
jgi:hypothetical protein